MVYDLRRGADQRAWYAELQQREGVWTVVRAVGTSVEELTQLETAYQDRLAPLHPDPDQPERRRLCQLALDAVFSSSYATAAVRIERFHEAEAIHRHATTLDGDPDEAFENLGFVLRSLGRLEEAIEAFEAAREICPDADVSAVLDDLRTAIELRDSNEPFEL